jgi:hypothetical protein
MSNDQIPGVPEGWELVRVGAVHHGEWRLMDDGSIRQWLTIGPSTGWAVVLRKIEKPAAYRQFANAAEYMPHWGKPIRMKGGAGFDSVVSTSMIGVYIATATEISYYSTADAFEQFTFADGTPFGVRIDE